ncbi:MAG: hypothetical protein KTR31_04290, partial [Myxococcales bacterium]|nr:hypothetical protein [Myxococcales bacterium]
LLSEGDLWLTIDDGERDRVMVQLPASWLATDDESVTITTADGSQVDLAEEAQELRERRVGATRRFVIDHDGEPVDLVLRHERQHRGTANSMEVAALGPKGRGLTFSLPLKPGSLGPAEVALDSKFDLDGVDVDFDEALCDQLRRSDPRTLVEVTGKGGGVFRLRTMATDSKE